MLVLALILISARMSTKSVAVIVMLSCSTRRMRNKAELIEKGQITVADHNNIKRVDQPNAKAISAVELFVIYSTRKP